MRANHPIIPHTPRIPEHKCPASLNPALCYTKYCETKPCAHILKIMHEAPEALEHRKATAKYMREKRKLKS